MRTLPAAIVLCLLAAPCLPVAGSAEGGASPAETPFEKNRALMERGEYKAAVKGFMNMVIANPEDVRAREHLRLAAERVVAQERADALAQKNNFMDEANDSRKLIMSLRAVKEKRSRPWRADLSRAVSLAGNIRTVKAGVLAYEKWLEATPVYSGNRKEYQEGLKRIKDAFYSTIKGRYPYLVQGRTTVDARDLASLTFSEESISDDASHYVETNQTQKVLEKADKLRRLERLIDEHYAVMDKATELYSRTHYEESMTGFRDVLAFDAFNEEALFFLDQAQKRGAQQAAVQGRK